MLTAAVTAGVALSLIGASGRAQTPSPGTTQPGTQPGGSAGSQQGSSAGGQQDQSSGGQQGQSSGGQQNGTRLSSADRRFIQRVAQDSTAEVELGRLASQQASSDAVRRFGQRMVQDHTRANDELMRLAGSRGLTVSPALDKKHRSLSTRLARMSGSEFDQAYMKQMVKDHQTTVSRFERESTQGQDPEVRQWASQMLPALREHLEMARGLAPGSNGNSTASGGSGSGTGSSGGAGASGSGSGSSGAGSSAGSSGAGAGADNGTGGTGKP